MQSTSRWIARRALLRIVALTLGAALALVVAPVATSAAAISITEPAAGKPSGRCRRSAARRAKCWRRSPSTSTKARRRPARSSKRSGPRNRRCWANGASPTETGLVAGTYTATSEQPEAVLEPGPSEPVTFTVNTKPPTITLEKLPPRSNEAKPTFSGTASEPGTVTVQVHEGTGNGGPVATTLTATVGETGDWSVTASSALSDGPYTAVATEPSAIGNGTGESPNADLRNLHAPSGGGIHEGAGGTLESDQTGLRRHDDGRGKRTGPGPHPQGRRRSRDLGSDPIGRQMVDRRGRGTAGRTVHRAGNAGELDRERSGIERSDQVRSRHGRAGSHSAGPEIALEGHETDVPRDGDRSGNGDRPRPRRSRRRAGKSPRRSKFPYPKPGNGA